jgi:hypothetical protein
MAEEEIVDSGTMWTPESARMKRRLAEAMLKAGMSTEPISSHWQGLARIANAMLGGYEMHSLGKEDSARAREEREYSNAPYKPSPSLTADPAGVKSPKPTDVADASQPAPHQALRISGSGSRRRKVGTRTPTATTSRPASATARAPTPARRPSAARRVRNASMSSWARLACSYSRGGRARA